MPGHAVCLRLSSQMAMWVTGPGTPAQSPASLHWMPLRTELSRSWTLVEGGATALTSPSLVQSMRTSWGPQCVLSSQKQLHTNVQIRSMKQSSVDMC